MAELQTKDEKSLLVQFRVQAKGKSTLSKKDALTASMIKMPGMRDEFSGIKVKKIHTQCQCQNGLICLSHPAPPSPPFPPPLPPFLPSCFHNIKN